MSQSKNRSKTLFFAAILGVLFSPCSRLRAQSGTTSHHGRRITCASDDGHRHVCRADTSYGAQLVTQRSGSSCIQGSTWGYDSQGIWVDRGCRADFVLGAANITCSSNNGNREICPVDTSGGVQMVRQRSGSPCIQGSTWGYNRGNIWVSHGCRADFTLGNANQPGTTNAVTCSSNDGGRHVCLANTSGGVQLIRQISGSPCIQGSTWGYDREGIWVDRGCRANFSIGYSNQIGTGTGNTITCSSNDGGRHVCPVNTYGGVQLIQQISGSPCIQGTTWGYDNQGIWVDRGCRANFSVGMPR